MGRTPVISGRVPESLHRRIQEAAKRSGRSMSEELAALADEALDHRDRCGNSTEAWRTVEWLAATFAMTGERSAKEKGLRQDWTSDLDCRRAAVARLCEAALTGFLSADPEEQLLVLAALKGRVAMPLFNPRLRKGGE